MLAQVIHDPSMAETIYEQHKIIFNLFYSSQTSFLSREQTRNNLFSTTVSKYVFLKSALSQTGKLVRDFAET